MSRLEQPNSTWTLWGGFLFFMVFSFLAGVGIHANYIQPEEKVRCELAKELVEGVKRNTPVIDGKPVQPSERWMLSSGARQATADWLGQYDLTRWTELVECAR